MDSEPYQLRSRLKKTEAEELVEHYKKTWRIVKMVPYEPIQGNNDD